ncbi:hypothetical protein ACS0TY_030945 [Phlomoides rotata]
MYSAVCECYASFRNIVNFLVHGKREKEVIEYIFSEVDKHIEEDDLLSEYKLNALPNLYELFVRLVKYLLDNKPEDRDQIVILFQDMLEVVTRDIMEDHVSKDIKPENLLLDHEFNVFIISSFVCSFPVCFASKLYAAEMLIQTDPEILWLQA